MISSKNNGPIKPKPAIFVEKNVRIIVWKFEADQTVSFQTMNWYLWKENRNRITEIAVTELLVTPNPLLSV